MLAEYTADFISVHDREERRLYVSPSYFRATGWTMEELESSSWCARLHPDDMPAVLQARAGAWAGQTTRFDHRVRCKNGAWLWGEVRCVPVPGPDGQVQQIVLWTRDITQRKAAEDALAAERWRLQHLFEHTPVATWLEDFTALQQWLEQLRSQGVTDLAAFLGERPDQVAHALGLIRVLDMNPAAVIQNAAQSKQHLLENLPLLFNERTYADFTAELVALWQGRVDFEYESHGRRLDGRPLVALVRLDIPLRDGKPDFSQVVVTGSDITERKQAEAKLQELLEQTRRDAHTKAELLKEVNHRVKNNLLAILGLALAEQRYLSAEERPVAQRFTGNLRRRIEGLLEVHQMLSASLWAPVLVNQLAQKIIQSVLAATPVSCPVKLVLQPSTVKVSPRQAGNLALVFNELATNTVKYALAQRAAVQVTFAATTTESHIRLEYRDDGPGYPPEVLRQERLSVGLTLVRDLTTETLRGQLTLANDSGAVAVLKIKTEEIDRT